MKAKENAGEIRSWIISHWRDDTDAVIAARYGVSRQYVMTARQRLGLSKDIKLISEIRTINKKKRATSPTRAHRRISDIEKLQRYEARITKQAEEKATSGRSIEEVMREYSGNA